MEELTRTRRGRTPRGNRLGRALPYLEGALRVDFAAWLAATVARHRADLEFRELRKGAQALSWLYVERRGEVRSHGAELRPGGVAGKHPGQGAGEPAWPLRAEKKLAYNVNSVATRMIDGGILEAYLETDKDKKAEALEALREVLAGLRQSGVTLEDLRAARVSVWARFLRDNEARPSRALNLAAFEALGLGLDFYYGLRAELEAVSLEEFNSFIKSVLEPENSVTVVIGPGTETLAGQSSSSFFLATSRR